MDVGNGSARAPCSQLRRLALISCLAVIGMTGCQGPPAPPESPAGTSDAAADVVVAEAPAACGFAEGTALEFAGRSTTATLGVQEVVGDPASHEPADIYITRESFDRGEHHGRLVCAISVDQPQVVEVTVHPADDPFVAPTPAPLGSEPADGILRTDAVEAAQARVGGPDEWEVVVVRAGSVARLVPDWENVAWARELPADRWVWRVFLVRGDEGADVFIDYADGGVLGELRYIVD